MSIIEASPPDLRHPSGPISLGDLLAPGRHARSLIAAAVVGTGAGVFVGTVLAGETWQAVALFLAVLLVPLVAKWRDDLARFGLVTALGGALVTVQGLHSVEHGVQWAQRHLLGMSLRDSNGLLSPANSEWVHFVWNWLVLLAILALVWGGMRSVVAWALVAWATAHTLEHTYLFVRFLQASSQLDGLGVAGVTAQGLPGVVGDGGWLDVNGRESLSYVCNLPGITTADRVDAHFVWNAGEMLLLVPAVARLVRERSTRISWSRAPRG